jgi:hypothetical protein
MLTEVAGVQIAQPKRPLSNPVGNLRREFAGGEAVSRESSPGALSGQKFVPR